MIYSLICVYDTFFFSSRAQIYLIYNFRLRVHIMFWHSNMTGYFPALLLVFTQMRVPVIVAIDRQHERGNGKITKERWINDDKNKCVRHNDHLVRQWPAASEKSNVDECIIHNIRGKVMKRLRVALRCVAHDTIRTHASSPMSYRSLPPPRSNASSADTIQNVISVRRNISVLS